MAPIKFRFALTLAVSIASFLLYFEPLFAIAPLKVSEHAQYYYDISAQKSIEDLVILDDLQYSNEIPRGGIFSGAVWAKIKLPVGEENLRLIIDQRLMIDHYWIYLVSSGKVIFSNKIGYLDKRASSEFYKGIKGEFVVPKHTDSTLLIREKNGYSLNFDEYIFSEKDYEAFDLSRERWFGLYFGLLMAMILYNLFLFFSLRDRIYFYYVLCVIFTDGLNVLSIFGLLDFYMAGITAKFALFANMICSMMVFCNITFARTFLNTKKLVPIVDFLLKAWSAIVLGLLPLSAYPIFFSREIISAMIGLSILLSAVAIFITSLHLILRKHSHARFFFLAWSFLLVAMIVETLYLHGMVEGTTLTRYAIMLGGGAETLLLSFALAHRFKLSEQAKRAAMEEVARIEKEKEKETSRLHAIVKIAQMIAHDIRNPFAQMRCLMELVRNCNPKEVSALCERYIPRLHLSISHAEDILSDMMELDRKTKLDLKATSIYELMSNSILQVFDRSDKNLKIKYDFQHVYMPILEARSMSRVIVNLSGNAVEASGHGEVVTYSTLTEGNDFIFKITNRGSNLSEEAIARIFEPFYTTKKSGTGLGLAICQRIIESHHGKIFAFSSTNSVTFAFRIPTSNIPDVNNSVLPRSYPSLLNSSRKLEEETDNLLQLSEKTAKIISRASLRNRGVSLLIIDDEDIYRQALRAQIDLSHEIASIVDIKEAKGASDALQLAQGGGIDLVVLDYDLNEADDGFIVATEIRKALPNAFICMHSNRVFPNFVESSMQSGANMFMPKPMTRPHILSLMLTALSEQDPLGDEVSEQAPAPC